MEGRKKRDQEWTELKERRKKEKQERVGRKLSSMREEGLLCKHNKSELVYKKCFEEPCRSKYEEQGLLCTFHGDLLAISGCYDSRGPRCWQDERGICQCEESFGNGCRHST